MLDDLGMREVQEIYPIRENKPDDLFITCGSFEERFLGISRKVKGNFPSTFILFRFAESNDKREKLIGEIENTLYLNRRKEIYHQVQVEHGKSVESILDFHRFLQEENLYSRELFITIDISTFTKDLLLNIMFYMNNLLQVKRLRLIYTVPGRYASPEEGWLSSGIKDVHIPPMCWNGWSPIRDNLLAIILGFEEIRAWSLIDRFCADLDWLFITNPGSVSEWDNYCEEYNRRLLEVNKAKDKIPALGTIETCQVLSNHITNDIIGKYNIFICPLGTKAQIIGVVYFCLSNPNIPVNIITTTAVTHNTPYYSWDIGATYESYFPIMRSNSYD